MVGASHVINVVLDISRICRRPPWVGGRWKVMWGVLSKGLLPSRRNSRPWVKGPRGGGCIMGIPQQVNIKGVLHCERKKSDTLKPSVTMKYY